MLLLVLLLLVLLLLLSDNRGGMLLLGDNRGGLHACDLRDLRHLDCDCDDVLQYQARLLV